MKSLDSNIKVLNNNEEWVNFPEMTLFKGRYEIPKAYFDKEDDGKIGKIKCKCGSITFTIRFFSYPWPREYFTEVKCSSCGNLEILSKYKGR